MHAAAPRFAFLLALAATAQAVALPLATTLGEDQRSERLVVSLDGREIGTLAVDAEHAEARVELVLDADVHRWRLEGETVLADGTKRAVRGAGLIVTGARMNEIGEARTGAAAYASYVALLDTLRAAAPDADLADVTPVAGAKATDAELAAAEKRLRMAFPAGYAAFLREVGSLRMGPADYATAEVFAPARVLSARDLTLQRQKDDGWTERLDETAAGLDKRFPRAKRDVVLDFWELSDPTVLMPDAPCPEGQAALALPGSDFDLLLVNDDQNPFFALITYDDAIMGEPECDDGHRLLAYSLHDHLLGMAREVLVLRSADTRVLRIARGDATDDDGPLPVHLDAEAE